MQDVQDIQEGASPKKKKKSVADQFAAVCRGQVYVRNVLMDSKTKQGSLRVDKY
jgi:hypothetical protein